MKRFVNHFFEEKSSFVVSNDCRGSSLKEYFSDEGWVFNPELELVKANASQVQDLFYRHCFEQHTELGAVDAITTILHDTKGDYDNETKLGVLYGTLSERTEGSRARKEARLKYSFSLEQQDNSSWKILHMHFVKVQKWVCCSSGSKICGKRPFKTCVELFWIRGIENGFAMFQVRVWSVVLNSASIFYLFTHYTRFLDYFGIHFFINKMPLNEIWNRGTSNFNDELNIWHKWSEMPLCIAFWLIISALTDIRI